MKLRIFQTLSQSAFLLFAFASPFFFLPLFSEFFDTSKIFFTIAAALALVFCWASLIFLKRTIHLTISPLLLPVVLVLGAVLASSLIGTSYSFEAFMGRGILFLALGAIFIAGTSLPLTLDARKYVHLISVSAAVVSILSVLQAVGFGVSKLLNTVFTLDVLDSPLFNPVGSLLAATVFMVPVLVLNLSELLIHSDRKVKLTHGIFTVVIALGCVVNIFLMSPNQVGEPVFFPIQASWSIATDILKYPKTALFGVGPESYGVAFTRFRPTQLNLTDFWNVRFASGRTEPLHLLTTTGLLGLGAMIFLWVRSLQLVFPITKKTRPFAILLGSSILFQLVLPANVPHLIFYFVTLIALIHHLKAEKDARISEVLLHLFAVNLVPQDSIEQTKRHRLSQTLSILSSLVLFAGVFVVGYIYLRVVNAEYLFGQSLYATKRNDGVRTYMLQQQAVTLQPNSDRFHRSFSTTSLLIAKSIAEQKDAPEDQKAKISPLLQQSVEQAKIATDIDPRKVSNWENLASIYRLLMNSVEGADQWTIAAIIRAIQIDPTNPSLRFELGNVYSSLQNYEQAIRLYLQAIELKPNWANAYFNLANAYKLKGDNALALETLQHTRQFVQQGSPDSELLEKSITDLEKLIEEQSKNPKKAATPANSQTQNGELSIPEGQIRLPEELGLPEETPPLSVPSSAEKPTPTASPTPTPAQ